MTVPRPADAGVPAADGTPVAGRATADGSAPGPTTRDDAAARPDRTGSRVEGGPERRLVWHEVALVFGVSLGASALYSLVNYIGDLTAPGPVRKQVATLNGSQAPGRPWLDLALQLVSLATSLVPVLLAAHFMTRGGESVRVLGVDRERVRSDVLRGALLAAGVGGTGLGFYLLAYHAGANLTVVPENLPDVWWRPPVLVLSALQNALLEEVLVVGYLLHRLRQLGVADNAALLASAVLRGSYHLYQGLGGFAANAAMGLLFARLYQRWGRVAPLVVAHTLIDAVTFLGYAALRGKVSWLPVPQR